MTHDVIVVLACAGRGRTGARGGAPRCSACSRSSASGRRLRGCARVIWGYELWLAFLVSAIATAGSLFFSEIANFIPCELCWYQRIFMYPVAIVTLLAAIANDHRVARYLLRCR